ncbi:hypothetical protein JL09_g1158, partial [Pichia kudriavzevii]
MPPAYPYPHVSALKRSSIASERPYTHIHKHPLTTFDNSFNSPDSSMDSLSNFQHYSYYDENLPAKQKYSNDSFAVSEAQLYNSCYTSPYPLYALDWSLSGKDPSTAKIALSSYRDGSTNKLEILYGHQTPNVNKNTDSSTSANTNTNSKTSTKANFNEDTNQNLNRSKNEISNADVDYKFSKAYEQSVKYPITKLQWDPNSSMDSLSNFQHYSYYDENLPAKQKHSNDSFAVSEAQLYNSCYTSPYPLYALDWSLSGKDPSTAKIALSSYRDGSTNKLEILYGHQTPNVNKNTDSSTSANTNTNSKTSPKANFNEDTNQNLNRSKNEISNADVDYKFSKAYEQSVKYPITKLQWDP